MTTDHTNLAETLRAGTRVRVTYETTVDAVGCIPSHRTVFAENLTIEEITSASKQPPEVRYFRLPQDMKPQWNHRNATLYCGSDDDRLSSCSDVAELVRIYPDLVECDTAGWTFTRDRDGDVWTVRGDEHRVWGPSSTAWSEETAQFHKVCAPHTPIHPAYLTRAQREGLK